LVGPYTGFDGLSAIGRTLDIEVGRYAFPFAERMFRVLGEEGCVDVARWDVVGRRMTERDNTSDIAQVVLTGNADTSSRELDRQKSCRRALLPSRRHSRRLSIF